MKLSFEHRDRLLLIAALDLLSQQQMDQLSDTQRIQRQRHKLQMERKVPPEDPSSSTVYSLQELTSEQAQSFDSEREQCLQRLLHQLQFKLMRPARDPDPDSWKDLVPGDGVLDKVELHEVVHVMGDVLLGPLRLCDDEDGENWPWVPMEELRLSRSRPRPTRVLMPASENSASRGMQFHNVVPYLYDRVMRAKPPTIILARLRRSTRLAVFMVLVFALKIGGIVTCTAHDILDPANGAANASASVMLIDNSSEDGSNGNPFDLGGSCEHCGCHQTVAIMPVVSVFQSPCATGTADWFETAARHVLLPKELRPPIA